MSNPSDPEADIGPDEEAAAAESALIDRTRVDLGRQIRAFREQRGISGRSLAAQIDVTSGFISQVEAGAVSPSVATLVKLAAVFGVPLGDLFGATAPSQRVVRKDDRISYTYPGGSLTEERLCSDPRLDVVEATFEPGASSGSEPYTESNELKFYLVLSGRFELELGDEEHALAAGDAIAFSGRTPHRLVNRQKNGRGSLLWINLPKP